MIHKRDHDLDDEPVRVDSCSFPGCRRLTSSLFCKRHQRELAVLHTELDQDGEREPPPEAA
jgi:hypothetical protein